MKIAFFSNSRLGLPAFDKLARQGLIAGLCVPNISDDDKDRLRAVAQQHSIPVLDIESSNVEQQLLPWLKEIGAEVGFVMTFPHKISAAVLNSLPHGFYNFHFSRLPQFRGAEPIFWELATGQTKGAICVHQMDEGWDTGPIVLTKETTIGANDTHGMYLTKVSMAAPSVALEVLKMLNENALQPVPQDESAANYYNKPGFNELRINWAGMTHKQVLSLVRAGNPWNRGAFSTLRGVPVRVTEMSVCTNNKVDVPIGSAPGTIVTDKKQHVLAVLCSDNALLSLDVVSTEDGVLPGLRLFEMGIRPGERFE